MTLAPGPDWTDQDVFDRGKAEFFHGREPILRTFQKECARAIQTNGGTILLIEGAPGAGKSALLHECFDWAARTGWLVAENMEPEALFDITQMRKQMGQLRHFQIDKGTFGFKGLGLSASPTQNRPVDALAAAEQPLLLILDEAQLLYSVSTMPQHDANRRIATSTLKQIHNGTLGKPVMLLAGGLGTTTQVFRELGISRFGKRRRIELGSLARGAERALLHDWLTIRGKAQGDPTPWIDAIMQETHGWPHHIMSYVDSAMMHLPDANGVMTSPRLQQVLAGGREGCTEYYLQRTGAFRSKQLRALVRAFPGGRPGTHASDDDILASLTTAFPQQGEAERLFDRALEKGVLSRQGSQYVIPIPSMHTWLEREYGSHQVAKDSPTLGGWPERDSEHDLGR